MLVTKKNVILLVILTALCASAFAQQQITRVAVIDLKKIYTTYYKDSQAVRALEEEKSRVSEEIRKLNEELKEMQKQRLTVLQSGDAQALKEFDEKLYRKAQYLSDYIKVKQAELDAKADALAKGDEFVQLVYRKVESIAVTEGYSLVLVSKVASTMASSVFWSSPMIDITDKVIQALITN